MKNDFLRFNNNSITHLRIGIVSILSIKCMAAIAINSCRKQSSGNYMSSIMMNQMRVRKSSNTLTYCFLSLVVFLLPIANKCQYSYWYHNCKHSYHDTSNDVIKNAIYEE